eukprot:617064_1
MSLKLNRDSSKLQGCMVIAQALKDQGVKYIFGIVGIPVTEIALCAQMIGIKFIGMRNEQAASYAAGAVGYMTGTPGVCLTVSGPGVIHAIAGLANAWSNCWPMLLLGGACEREQTGKGAFQEAPQMESVAMFTKYRARPNSISRIPFFVEQALRTASYGRPDLFSLRLLIAMSAPPSIDDVLVVHPYQSDGRFLYMLTQGWIEITE